MNLLKRGRILRRTSKSHQEARQDELDTIERFTNPTRWRVRCGMLPLAEFEQQQILKAEGA